MGREMRTEMAVISAVRSIVHGATICGREKEGQRAAESLGPTVQQAAALRGSVLGLLNESSLSYHSEHSPAGAARFQFARIKKEKRKPRNPSANPTNLIFCQIENGDAIAD